MDLTKAERLQIAREEIEKLLKQELRRVQLRDSADLYGLLLRAGSGIQASANAITERVGGPELTVVHLAEGIQVMGDAVNTYCEDLYCRAAIVDKLIRGEA